jgi:hypothetical protein
MTALRRLLAGLGALAAVAALALPASPAAAQQARPFSEPETGLSLEVVALDGVVHSEQDLRLRINVRNANSRDREDLRLVATVHGKLTRRGEYHAALDDGVLGGIVHPFVADLQPIPAKGSRTIELRQTTTELGLARTRAEGVYPLRVQLLAGGEAVDEVTTSIVVVPTTAHTPLDVALLLPMGLPPALDAEGVVADPGLLHAIAEGGTLRGVAEALGAAERLQATLELDARTLRDVASLRDGFALRDEGVVVAHGADSTAARDAAAVLDGLSTLVARPFIEHISRPYGGADLTALTHGGLEIEARLRHLEQAAEELAAQTGVQPSTATLWPPAGIDAETHAMARGAGVDRLVLSEQWLSTGVREWYSPSPVRPLRGATTTALVPDPWIEGRLTDHTPDGAVIDAQRIIGELASVYFERPGTPRRGVLVAPPAGEHVDPALVQALVAPLQSPVFQTVTVTRLARRATPAEQAHALDYDEASREAELPSTYLAQLTQARRALGSLAGVVESAPDLGPRLDRLLLQAASVHYRDDPAQGRALLRTVSGTVQDLYGGVEVLENPPVTLTSVEGHLPIGIRSGAELPLRVLVTLASARYEVDGGATREIVLQPGETQVLTFTVRALTPGGTSPIQILVTDLQGDVEIAQGRVVVRSTAFSLVGLLITAGAAVFLLAWWLREAARRRRPTGEPTSDPRTARARPTASRR